nr:hypothetical protein [Chloroflexota bacterium]
MSTKRPWQKASYLIVTTLLVLACLQVVQPTVSGAQDTLPWRGEYFNNISLTGEPTRIRYDRAIDFNWGHNKPDDGLPVDYFSVRWTASIYFEGGTYSFKTYTDDGVRLWLDGQLLIDQWRNQPATLNQREVDVSPGYHNIRMEYYEHIGNAVAMLWWDRLTVSTTTMRWRAEYFNNPWLVGAPVLVREETDIRYDWGSNSPAPGIVADGFSVRWTGIVGFDNTDTYTFTVTVDDGVRVWIDGGLLIDAWRDQSVTTISVARYVTKGTHPITVEYYEGSGNACITFTWQRGVTGPPTPSPTTTAGPTTPAGEIIVDDKSSGFQKGGPNESWYERSIGYNGHIYWTYNSDAQVYNYARWTPQLPGAGNYQVYVFIPRERADTKSARYRIYHNGQQHTATVNQSIYFDKWVSLGTYYFAASGNEYVYLDDVTGEPYASRKIGFDAVKFVMVGAVSPTSTPAAPTPTPWVLTATPPPTATPIVVTPTATPIVPTPTPTPALPSCPITPILGFGRIWSTYATVRNRLGCPVEIEKNTWSAEETFIGGYMFWRGDLRLIYALYNDGTWQSFIDTWTEGQLEWDPGIVPPSGYFQPKRGFGKVWREQLVQPGVLVRDKLSWATTEERGLNASWQAYAGGLMLWSDTLGFFVLYYDNNTWSRYY